MHKTIHLYIFHERIYECSGLELELYRHELTVTMVGVKYIGATSYSVTVPWLYRMILMVYRSKQSPSKRVGESPMSNRLDMPPQWI